MLTRRAHLLTAGLCLPPAPFPSHGSGRQRVSEGARDRERKKEKTRVEEEVIKQDCVSCHNKSARQGCISAAAALSDCLIGQGLWSTHNPPPTNPPTAPTHHRTPPGPTSTNINTNNPFYTSPTALLPASAPLSSSSSSFSSSFHSLQPPSSSSLTTASSLWPWSASASHLPHQ